MNAAVFFDMRATVSEAAAFGGYTRRMFKADRASMRAWSLFFREAKRLSGSAHLGEAPEALRMARYFRDKSIIGSKPRRPIPHRQLDFA